jgi:hypothetical protein
VAVTPDDLTFCSPTTIHYQEAENNVGFVMNENAIVWGHHSGDAYDTTWGHNTDDADGTIRRHQVGGSKE